MSGLAVGFGVGKGSSEAEAVQRAVAQARSSLEGSPQLAFVTNTIELDAGRLHEALAAELGDTPLHGLTTSLGVLTRRGIESAQGGTVGVMLFGGVDVSMASAASGLESGARAAGKRAAEALRDDLAGKAPSLLFFNATPGHEEDVLLGVGEIFPNVPACGGSAADHAIAGQWNLITSQGPLKEGVSLAAIAGDVHVGEAFFAPYEAASERMKVTSAHGRTIASIDGKPAAQVLQGWIGESIAAQVASGGNILAQTALRPIGISLGGEDGRAFVAVHPAQAQPDGSIDVFARVEQGAEICRLQSSEEELVGSLGKLVEAALASPGIRGKPAKAALLTFCAGCAGAVGEQLHQALQSGLSQLDDGIPVLGMCTFGEQGFVPGVGNRHGNLSVGLVLLG